MDAPHTNQLHIRLAQIFYQPPSSSSLCRIRLFCSRIFSVLQRSSRGDSFDHRIAPDKWIGHLFDRLPAPQWRTALAAATNRDISQLPCPTFYKKEKKFLKIDSNSAKGWLGNDYFSDSMWLNVFCIACLICYITFYEISNAWGMLSCLLYLNKVTCYKKVKCQQAWFL